MYFENLLELIRSTHATLTGKALQKVNAFLSVKNWLIGMYIVEYEQNGEDRALYGERVFTTLGERLQGIKGMSESQLYLYRDFYRTYPQIFLTVSGILGSNEFTALKKFLTVSGESHLQREKQTELTKNQSENLPGLQPEMLIDRLSFSHFIELMKIESSLKRVFYETECVKNNWSVRELKRAIGTLLFERTGLSSDKSAVIAKIKEDIPAGFSDIVRNPYLLEFLGLEEKPEFTEMDLEKAIISHLQKFLMEMGRGFCFEARQKRITFDNNHYFIDLVFYHRILKCHVIIDLKIGEFDHSDAGQMNLYLNYYKENEMTTGDNQPVGIILCAGKNESLVRYALGGMSHEVFVAKYLVELPSEEELKNLLRREKKELEQNVE